MWDEPGHPTRTASELVNGLAVTWGVLQAALARYTTDAGNHVVVEIHPSASLQIQ
ncbi:MAG TPA: hypothetical protein VKQ36_12425 [Ktedonobacterales bacterium]|nr:hypothetical protein [Ktedonobacterales bacterium]